MPEGLTTNNKCHIDDVVHAFFAELCELKEVDIKIELYDLQKVVSQAEEFMGSGYKIEKSGPGFSSGPVVHPVSKLWTAGILDSSIYYEWAYAKERPAAEKQFDKTLTRMRADSAFTAGGHTYESSGLGPIVVDADYLRKRAGGSK